MKISLKMQKALVGGYATTRRMAERMAEREIVSDVVEASTARDDRYEFTLTPNGKELARLYAARGVQPLPQVEYRQVLGLWAITVLQPYAACFLIEDGPKTMENRGKSMSRFAARRMVGRRIAIIEGKGVHDDAAPTDPLGRPWPAAVAPGHVILTAEIAGIQEPTEGLEDPWRIRCKYGIVLDEIRRLPKPVAAQGQQGWINLHNRQPEVAAAVMSQERASVRFLHQ